MELELATPEFRELTLHPKEDERRTRSYTYGLGTPGPLAGPISIGGPAIVRLSRERATDDADLQAFVAGDSKHRYDLVHLAATFAPVDEELERAWITVHLRRPDDAPSPAPIAWSMQPISLADEVTTSNKAVIGADAKLIKAGFETGGSRVSKDVSLQALFAMQSNPTWILEHTDSAQITGVQRFVLVVRSPADAPARGRVEVGALVKQRRLVFLSRTSPLESVPAPLEFDLATA